VTPPNFLPERVFKIFVSFFFCCLRGRGVPTPQGFFFFFLVSNFWDLGSGPSSFEVSFLSYLSYFCGCAPWSSWDPFPSSSSMLPRPAGLASRTWKIGVAFLPLFFSLAPRSRLCISPLSPVIFPQPFAFLPLREGFFPLLCVYIDQFRTPLSHLHPTLFMGLWLSWGPSVREDLVFFSPVSPHQCGEGANLLAARAHGNQTTFLSFFPWRVW